MKLTIERAELLKALSHVQSVVERRNTIPILSNVKLAAEDGKLALTATDLDLAFIEAIDARVDVGGVTTAPALTLHDIVRKIPEGAQIDLTVTGEGQRLQVAAGRSRFTLSCLPAQDFPEIKDDNLPHRFKLSASDLKRLIDKTRFAVSTEETRYYLNGIYFHVADSDGGQVLRAVATDGHRLARVEMPAPAGAKGMPGVIVPRKTVNELRKLIDEFAGEISVGLSDSKIRFTFNDAVLSSKLIDGTFPDYGRVIPANNDKVAELDARLFADAVDRVSTISTDKTRAVKLTLNGNKLELSVTSPDNGAATDELAATYGGVPLEVGFNSRYLLDILAQIDGNMAQMLLADAASPTLLKDAEDEGALYVLMPMRV
ncbi:MAG: DNA polymerase III subunit beta [Sphingomonadales bacterium]|nr:DNA polymerase III subunit beta [Sphingomonadales bacterium]